MADCTKRRARPKPEISWWSSSSRRILDEVMPSWACLRGLNLWSLDASLLSRTNSVVSAVNAMSSDGSLSPRTVEEATNDLLYVNGLLVELSGAIKRDPELCKCVKEYLSSTDEILKSLGDLKQLLENARDAERILKHATEYFMQKDYENTEKELQNFN
ncbi:UPF0496 protein [Canna indica]|uniref:UPF0496 protein n=1 Tax=Canna indica TaxID=4628 RepID=A0AAQ3KQU2_9LILI|nr:UPF0496 protein [Canna indica]